MSNRKLAIEGGSPAFSAGPPEWPLANEAIVSAVNDALRSGDWGKYDSAITAELIESLKTVFAVEHVQLCSSGTIAVELTLRGAGVKAGDEVIMAAYDFPGNFRAVEAIGARPVLIDLVSDSNWLLNLEQVANANSDSARALLVSHLHGCVVDMKAAREVAEQNALILVEDACQSPGGTIEGTPIGAWGQVAALSFGGSKLLSAGRGGAILTNDETMLQRARIFANRGNDAFPLSQLQAAVLVPQLVELQALTMTRHSAVQTLMRTLKGLDENAPSGGQVPSLSSNSPFLPENAVPAFYKFALSVDPSIRDQFICGCVAEGIAIGEGFRGFANRSQKRCRKPVPLPHCIAAAKQTVLINHPILLQSTEQIEKLGEVLHGVHEYVHRHLG